MISSVFIRRPRLAIVISIVISIAGVIALRALPVAQFPEIVPPQVQVSTVYPGASAAAVEAVGGVRAGQVRPGGREHDGEGGQGHGRGDGLDAELKHAEPDHDTTPRC